LLLKIVVNLKLNNERILLLFKIKMLKMKMNLIFLVAIYLRIHLVTDRSKMYLFHH